MYTIYMKKIDQKNALPVAQGSQVNDIKNARKYRKIEVAERDFYKCCTNYTEFLWTIRDIKTGILFNTNALSVLKIWNKYENKKI